MKYAVPLFLKFFMILFVLGVILWMFDMSFMNILFLSILVTVISLIGDMVILPRYGNVIATIVDFSVVFFVVLFGSAFLLGGVDQIGWAAFTPAVLIALGEAFFHKFLRKYLFEDAYPSIDATYDQFDGTEQFDRAELEHLRTEFSNEFDIGNPEGEVEQKKKKYVPHRSRKRNKKRPY